MKDISYVNEYQFQSDLSSSLRAYNSYFEVKTNTVIEHSQIDMLLTDQKTGKKIAIEIKGGPSYSNLPPEIIPSLLSLKKTVGKYGIQFVILSLSNVSTNTRKLFERDELRVFAYEENKKGFLPKFIKYLNAVLDK